MRVPSTSAAYLCQVFMEPPRAWGRAARSPEGTDVDERPGRPRLAQDVLARRRRTAAEGGNRCPVGAADVDVVDAVPPLERTFHGLRDELVALAGGREELDRAPGGHGD